MAQHPVALLSRTFRRSRIIPFIGLCGFSLALLSLPTFAAKSGIQPIQALIVGGGPDLENNQVAIESNVRYVSKLLGKGAQLTTLFADGDPEHETVLFDDSTTSVSVGEQILSMTLTDAKSEQDSTNHYRKPNLGCKLNGPSKKREIQRSFTDIATAQQTSQKPLLLYFTGHGSPNNRSLDNNFYDLWGKGETITVGELSREIARLPEETPVTLVMVQCFSGAFGNLILQGGDPQGAPVKRDIAGFFATVKERVAAGCTSAINEAEYHDFTSYFFAALTGKDRVGRRVKGADFNRDGRVGMDEAYAYTLIHDDSIDVPVCTSDVFLRRFVPANDRELFENSRYQEVLSWATPAQKAALEGLSNKLKKSGDDRLFASYILMQQSGNGAPKRKGDPNLARKYQDARNEARRNLFSRWPELRRPGSSEFTNSRVEAVAQLNREENAEVWKRLMRLDSEFQKSAAEGEEAEIADSQNLRFVRLGKSVALAHKLMTGDNAEMKDRYSKLIEAEGRTLLAPVK